MLKLKTFGSNQRFINAWRYFAKACPQREILAANELVFAWGNIDNMLFNAAFLTQPVRDKAELEAKIKMAGNYAKKRDRPWWMVVAEDWIPELLLPQMDSETICPCRKIPPPSCSSTFALSRSGSHPCRR